MTDENRDDGFEVLMERFAGPDPDPLHDDQREQVYKTIAETLNDSGIPWPRAVDLAERCLKSLRGAL